MSNSEELQPLLVYILISICLKISAESIEYFFCYFYFDNFKNVHFYVGYSISCHLIVCPLSQRNISTQLTTIHSFMCVSEKLELHVLIKVCAFPKHLHLCTSLQSSHC